VSSARSAKALSPRSGPWFWSRSGVPPLAILGSALVTEVATLATTGAERGGWVGTACRGCLLTDAPQARASCCKPPERCPRKASWRCLSGLAPARTLNLSLACSAVQVCPPVNDPKHKGCEPLDASVLRVWDAQHAVEWVLLFTGTLNSFEQAAHCVGWYEQRWSIEEFHKCLKSGCRIEHSQLKQARAVQALLGFSSIVAVRLLALARLARARPDEPAAQHIEARYLRVLCAMRKLPAELTVRAYWREVARMGDFLGRTHDRDPGWQTLWKGLEKLETWVVAWLDGFEEGRTCG
jgi:hypothetical protein